MKIGILQTGRSPEEISSEHGDYDSFFRRMLGGRGFDFVTYPVLDGVLPSDVRAADGWLITGSRFGVYEDHAWIRPLEAFIRRAYEASVPLVGICFGHQIIAQALGGKVEKFAGGWSVGTVDYAFEGFDDPARLLAFHQDQVVEKPADARVVGSSAFCRFAALVYGDRAYSIQPHPEFTEAFVADLLVARRELLPAGVAEEAERSLGQGADSTAIANQIEAFFKQARD